MFFSEEVDDEEHNEMVDDYFRSDYWELLAPTLTKLDSRISGLCRNKSRNAAAAAFSPQSAKSGADWR